MTYDDKVDKIAEVSTSKLTTWEVGFIGDIIDIDEDELSEKQKGMIDIIYKKLFGEEDT